MPSGPKNLMSGWIRTNGPYYWLTGVFQLNDEGTDTDVWALMNDYVSVVPVQFDMTAHYAIPLLDAWKFNS